MTLLDIVLYNKLIASGKSHEEATEIVKNSKLSIYERHNTTRQKMY